MPEEQAIPEVIPEAEAKDFVPSNEEEKNDKCPWCNQSKTKNLVLKVRHGRWQCGTCGKMWDEKALGKPYTEALERGESWEREMQARRLRES